MRLLAISDLHIGISHNKRFVSEMSTYPEDILILAGDICEKISDLEWLFASLNKKFKQLVWVPGNHELWVTPGEEGIAGEVRYQRLIELCRQYNVINPEDEYRKLSMAGRDYYLVPMFLLYDYSFKPEEVPANQALDWAKEHGLVCADEYFLKHEPFESKEEWCRQRVIYTRERLMRLPQEVPKIFVNHFPMRYDLVTLPRIPRFSIWCGTNQTENWHVEFNAHTVVYGHLHYRNSFVRDGVRFEEVSLGNPNQYSSDVKVDNYIRGIL